MPYFCETHYLVRRWYLCKTIYWCDISIHLMNVLSVKCGIILDHAIVDSGNGKDEYIGQYEWNIQTIP